MSKILFLSHDSNLQGAERCLLDLVTYLDRSRFEPLVILPWPGPLQEKLEQAEIPYLIRYILKPWIGFNARTKQWRWPLFCLKDLKSRLWALLTLIEREQIDLVYTNTSTVIEGALAAKRAGIPHLWHIHEHLRGNPDLRLFLPPTWTDRLTLTLADRIITPSQALAESRFPGSPKVRVVPNGVDLASLQTGNDHRVRTELGIPAEAAVITFIGAISPCKDPLTFIRAAARIRQTFPEVWFLMAGAVADPTLESQVKSLADNPELRSHLRILGYRNDAADILAAATVHVSTSTKESFGLTLTEAMACGKPVVATHCGGPEEIVVDGKTGFVVPPGDPEAVASAVIKLLENPKLAEAFGKAGQKRAQQKYSVEAYASGIETVLEEGL